MTRPFTVQCGYAAYFANTVTVEADTLDQALEKALEAASQSDAWRALDHCGDSFVDAVCEGADADPWATDTALPVPDRFAQCSTWMVQRSGAASASVPESAPRVSVSMPAKGGSSSTKPELAALT